jgi:hypothetical protein
MVNYRLQAMWMILGGAYGVFFGRIYCDVAAYLGRGYGPLVEWGYVIGFASGMFVGLVVDSLATRINLEGLWRGLIVLLPILVLIYAVVLPALTVARE